MVSYLNCVPSQRFFGYLFLYYYCILFSPVVEVESGGRKQDAALLVALWFVTWASICLIWEARPGHIPGVLPRLEGLKPGQ